MSEKVQCPNCLEPAEKVGNKITCTACDSVLTITRTGGAKLAEIGWKEKIEERLGILEVGVADETSAEANDAEADAEADAATDAAVEEDDILPR